MAKRKNKTRNKKIVRRKSGIHNYGVFAGEDIKKGERIVQYTGRLLTKAQSEGSNSDYIYELNSRADIDGRNIARYVNHSCEPNCESDVHNGQIWLTAIRDIQKSKELTYSYRYSLDMAPDYPCFCGAEHCVGFILDEEEWPNLEKLRSYRNPHRKTEKKSFELIEK